MITTILSIIIIMLLCILTYLIHKINKLNKTINNDRRTYLHNKNKISMLEYEYKNYKEGLNAFTVLRNISNILKED